VDEFQDTNFIQNAIVELLSNGTNVFRVGDVKQSIYRFRNAQPELMQGLKALSDDATHEVLYLTHNYRSTPTLVTFNNVLFDRLMNFDELDSAYSVNRPRRCGHRSDIANGRAGRVSLH
jgi:ATP-dependent helicase/nuclease subunit A